jgi:hypothetical protein
MESNTQNVSLCLHFSFKYFAKILNITIQINKLVLVSAFGFPLRYVGTHKHTERDEAWEVMQLLVGD